MVNPEMTTFDSRTDNYTDDVFVMPTSFGQDRLWFIHQFDPENISYNSGHAYRLVGQLNLAALEKSLNEIVKRHEILRTSFSFTKGQPVQVISPASKLSINFADLRNLAEADREAEAKRLATGLVRQPYDLAKSPPLRISVLCLDENMHVLVLALHHIIHDAWSADILFRELLTLYNAYSAGHPSPLDELPIQYADFSVWQREYLKGDVLERLLAYWKKLLVDVPPGLELPTSRPRPPIQTHNGACQTFVLPPSLFQSLKDLSRQENVTLFMTLLAAFKVLLNRYTGQVDIVVGSPSAGRTRIETEGLIGFFVNTLALRTNLAGNPSFRELLRLVREVALGAYAHEEVPFEKLVSELQPERDLSRTPIFQIMFNLINVPRSAIEARELAISKFDIESGIAPFDLDLTIVEKEGKQSIFIRYNTDIYDTIAIERLKGHFQTLLEAIVQDSEKRIFDLPLLTEAEHHQISFIWNDTKSDYCRDRRIDQLFETQVERSPEAVAVVFEDKQLTYDELNCRANQLAHHLRTLGVGAEVPVGICVDRSIEMVVGLLGILKAGGAYVPLDPAYPTERLYFMLADIHPPVLLTQSHLLNNLPAYTGEIICLDDVGPAIAQESKKNPDNGATSANLAYVIYTSGSTGQPKGVEIEHASVVNLITWHLQAYKVKPTDRATQLASLAFDASVWELWPYLTIGASIHIVDEETRAYPSKLLEWLSAKEITYCFMPTPLAESVLEERLPERLALRAVLTGGDKLHRRPPKDIPFRLINHYGPTENSVVTTWAPVEPPNGNDIPPPIGRPICNNQIYILDPHLNPVPIGIPGELHISGDGLARGYCNRPELTAEKFIQNPFSDDPESRMYRTGDLARFLSDGNIEFLGRIDHQVKIRGFRIELGEIESVLIQHPAVSEAVAIAREDLLNDKRLVAYVVADPKQIIDSSEIRDYLQRKLPAYMVPAAFVKLDQLPLDHNGKVDRKRLPTPDISRSALAVSFVAPRTPAEEVLAGIWCEVLGIESVGVYDNFFELGGHSLLATRIVSQVNEFFQVQFQLRSFFELPTIDGLVNSIARICGGSDAMDRRVTQFLQEVQLLSDDDS